MISKRTATGLAMSQHYPDVQRGVDPDVLADIGYADPETAVRQYEDAVELGGRLVVDEATRAAEAAAAARAADHAANAITYGHTGPKDHSPAQRATNARGAAAARKAIHKEH